LERANAPAQAIECREAKGDDLRGDLEFFGCFGLVAVQHVPRRGPGRCRVASGGIQEEACQAAQHLLLDGDVRSRCQNARRGGIGQNGLGEKAVGCRQQAWG